MPEPNLSCGSKPFPIAGAASEGVRARRRSSEITSVICSGSLLCGAATDTGRLREHNEDRYWIDAAGGIFLVVDGLGGHAAGELAAQTAVETIRASLKQTTPAIARVRNAITAANNRIFALAREREELAGMACVLTLAVVENGRITIGHVGDSRLYLMRHGDMRKLTSDHSLVGEREDAGELSESEAMRHPRRNEVFRDVGSRLRGPHDEGFIEIRQSRLRSDAALLLCSDGLTDQLPCEQIRRIVETHAGDPARVARELVDAANRAGGTDNVTALFVAAPAFHAGAAPALREVHGGGSTRPRAFITRPRGRTPRFTGRLACLIYGLLLGMLVWAAAHLYGVHS
jgi:PPM family protein phosphatase